MASSPSSIKIAVAERKWSESLFVPQIKTLGLLLPKCAGMVALILWLHCCLCSSEGVETVDVGAAKSLVGSGHLYLDVRTIEEFNKGHPENALNLPYMFFTPQGRVTNPQFLEQVSSICSKDDFIVVGFKNVKNMGGGYAAWVDNGFAIKIPQQ